MRKSFLECFKPNLSDDEINEVVDTLKSGWITTGKKTKQFETEFSSYVKSDHSIAVSSCTAALYLSLCALNIKQGDEVITSPFTFVSTVNVIIQQGAIPIFADINSKTYNIDPDRITEKITSRTKAIIIVDYAGQPCEYNKIAKIAAEYNIPIIEDAAHSLGAEYNEKKIGSLADLTCFSFYATKNVTTGEGGMITTNDDDLAEKIRLLASHGLSKDAWKRYSSEGSWFYDVLLPGYKHNFTDIQASLGIHQLRKLDESLIKRKILANHYSKELSKIEGVITPFISPNVKHAWHLYTIQIVEEICGLDRNTMIKELKQNNIGTSVHFIPVTYHSYYVDRFGYKKGDFPITENIYSQIITLPLYPQLSLNDVDDVIHSIKGIIDE